MDKTELDKLIKRINITSDWKVVEASQATSSRAQRLLNLLKQSTSLTTGALFNYYQRP